MKSLELMYKSVNSNLVTDKMIKSIEIQILVLINLINFWKKIPHLIDES